MNDSRPMQAIRKVARAYPDVEEGTVCNKSAFKAGKKSFLFLGADDMSFNVMLKLADSLPEAEKLAAKRPECFKVGVNGWVSIVLPHDEAPPAGVFEKWIDESYRLLTQKQRAAPPANPKTTRAKSKRVRKERR